MSREMKIDQNKAIRNAAKFVKGAIKYYLRANNDYSSWWARKPMSKQEAYDDWAAETPQPQWKLDGVADLLGVKPAIEWYYAQGE